MTGIEDIEQATMKGTSDIGIMVTDPHQPDNPITYANPGFARMTGYDQHEVLGRNCRFLQGEDTDPKTISLIREAIRESSEIEVLVVNYRKNGEPFLNRLLIAPIQDENDNLTAFFAVQRDETAQEVPEAPADPGEARDALPMLQELQHRVKNHLAMVVSMIRMQARSGVDADAFQALSHRIEALALLYMDLERTDRPGDPSKIDACTYLTRVARAIDGLEARESVTLQIDCEEMWLPVNTCAQLGLLVSELVTNALKHAFQGRDEGKVWVHLHALSGNGVRLIVEDDGVGIPDTIDWPRDSKAIETINSDQKPQPKTAGGIGGSIVRTLTSSLDAGLNVMTSLRGTTVTIDLPED